MNQGKVTRESFELGGKRFARLVLDREAKRNALDGALIRSLTEEAEALAADDGLHAVVVTGRGSKAFSAGADRRELESLGKANAAAWITRLHDAIQAVRAIPVPVVARIEGACIGGAMEIAAGCDLRVGGANAFFAMPEVLVGIPSVIEAALLPRIVGAGRANRLVMTGATVDAETAHAWGFLDALAGDVDSALEATLADLAKADATALRLQKELVTEWLELPLSESVERSIPAFARAYRGR